MKKTILVVGVFALFCLSLAEEFNGTTYRLSLSDIEVAQPINGSDFNLTLHEKAENISILSFDGKKTKVNSSYSFWGGDHNYRIHVAHSVTGNLIYTIPHQGQQFILPLHENGSMRLILPPGYTTGDRILGIARPDPDQVKTDNNGTVLTWINPQARAIEVGYYKMNAPQALKRIFALLAVIAALLLAEYSFSIRRLRALRKEAEK